MAHGFDVVKYHYFHQKLGYSSLKKEQLDIIVGFLNGRDVITASVTNRTWETDTLLCLYSLGDSMAWTNYVINLLLYWSFKNTLFSYHER